MTSLLSVIGLLVVATFDVGMYVLKLLAVVGGATLGGLGTGWGLRLLVKLSSQRPVPRPVLIPVRILGGIALGFAVWSVAFRTGGSSLGTGGLLGLQGGNGSGAGDKSDLATAARSLTPTWDSAAAANHPEVPRIDPDRDSVLRIEMLGGSRVHEERFYLIEGEREPKDLAGLRQAVLERRQQPGRAPLRALEILVYDDSVAKKHSAVRNLEKWAEEQGLAVIAPSTRGDAPERPREQTR
jgi:hypothetical protein